MNYELRATPAAGERHRIEPFQPGTELAFAHAVKRLPAKLWPWDGALEQ
jgi:hypothetical protein